MLTLTNREVSSLRSNELQRIKLNVMNYFLMYSSKYINNLSSDEYNTNIEIGLKRASRYELSTEYSLIKYIELMFKYKYDFDDELVIRRMLADEEVKENEKLDAVMTKLKVKK